MKPLNIDKSGCSNTSSNCVVWQGPNIECIDLCKGDSITEVVYKLAVELCTIMDTFNLDNYDLKCFAGGACKPTDFKEFIQLVINKICYVQSCSGCLNSCDPCDTTSPSINVTTSTVEGIKEVIVPIAPAFYYTNPQGDLVTTMPVDTYTVTIGNRVSNIVGEITTINATLVNHNTRITALELAPAPVVVLPDITPVCVMSGVTPMVLVVTALEQQFCELRVATGEPNNIFENVQKQIPNLANSQTLSGTGGTMSSLPGFTVSPISQADIIGNIWVTLGDMRIALQNIMDNYLPNDCSAINIVMTATYSPTSIVIYFTGTIPLGFVNTFEYGTTFTISDDFGRSITNNINIPAIINNPGGTTINIALTALNPSSNFYIKGSPNFTSTINNSQCQSILETVIQNQASCVPVTYTPGIANISFAFTTQNITARYTVEVRDSVSNALVTSASFVSSIIQPFGGTFSLLALTTYKTRMVVTINTIDTDCPYTVVTTL